MAGAVGKPIKFTAPVAGWRADVPVGDMPADAAFSLINWFPETGYVRIRNGSAIYNSGLSGGVLSLLPYSGTSAVTLFAAAGSQIYDVSVAGTKTVVASGFFSAHWSSSQISTIGGKFLTAVNGFDPPQLYNGSTWSAAAYTGGPTSVSLLSVVTTYRERLWFLEKNSTRLWYLDTQAIAGALTSLDVGANMKFGGTLVAIGAWTAETAGGVLAFLVLVSTEGEVLVYQGSNPADATNWSLLGTFKLSPPLGGDRCMTNVGGDLAIMTQDAVIPISKAIQLDPAASDVASITAHIAPAFLNIVQSVGSTTVGWEFVVFPRRRMAIVNVPDASGAYQLVMNTETKAWCQFQGMVASCWVVWENNLFFGTGDGNVMQADFGSNDNGNPIVCPLLGGWQRNDGFTQKHPTMIVLDMFFGIGASVVAGASVDYNYVAPTAPANPVKPVSGALWDVAIWDVDVWPGSSANRLIGAANCPPGVAFAPTITVTMNGETGQQSDCFLYGGALIIEPGTMGL